MNEESKQENSLTIRRNIQIEKEVLAEDCDLTKLRSLIWHGVNSKTRAVV